MPGCGCPGVPVGLHGRDLKRGALALRDFFLRNTFHLLNALNDNSKYNDNFRYLILFTTKRINFFKENDISPPQYHHAVRPCPLLLSGPLYKVQLR